MSRPLFVTINTQTFRHDQANDAPYQIRETDFISVKVPSEGLDEAPEFFFEDYRAESVFASSGEFPCFETPSSHYFAESFGFAMVRVECGDERLVIAFDVHAKKTNAEQARRMVQYLASHSASLINTCFARSSLSVGSSRVGNVDIETILTSAESFIETLRTHQIELMRNVREKLLPVKVSFADTNMFNREVDPYDIIGNLDALTPSAGSGDVFLRGRFFDLGDIDVATVNPTSDLLENRILLGGLYGIRRTVLEVQNLLQDYDFRVASVHQGYESFTRLMLSLTADGMLRRCSEIANACNGMIRLFQNDLGVRFVGELQPLMTPYARNTRVYRLLFNQLHHWYQLGEPTLGGLQFLMKLKSLSKLYELFVFFHLIEELYDLGWAIEDAVPHQSMGEFVPKKVSFRKADDRVSIEYEPVIATWNSNTEHMDLVDVGHKTTSDNPYWTPDYVMKFEFSGAVRYVILDAKYSTRASVREHHIPNIFSKYYIATGVYDEFNKIITHAPIIGVFAVYSLADQNASFLPRWSQHGIQHSLPRIPMVGGIGLMTDNSDLFKSSLASTIEIAQRTLHGERTFS